MCEKRTPALPPQKKQRPRSTEGVGVYAVKGDGGESLDETKERRPLSRRQLQSLLQRPLLQRGSLAKPGTVQPVFLTARPAFVVHELGDRA